MGNVCVCVSFPHAGRELRDARFVEILKRGVRSAASIGELVAGKLHGMQDVLKKKKTQPISLA